MSLDVHLIYTTPACEHCGREEEIKQIYSSNITHNLGKMADKAGIYYALWRPDEIGVKTAEQLIPLLELGLEKLKSNQEFYESFNSPNGWGLYEHFVPFVEDYLNACKQFPDAEVTVCR